MKYTAQGGSRVANIARGEAEVYFIQTKRQCFKCFIVCKVSTKYSSLVILTHLLNKNVLII